MTTATVETVTCGCPGCEAGLQPFTVEHFTGWAAELELDSGDPWIVDEWFQDFTVDYFAGIPEIWLLVPEGNSKTTGLAGLGVYLLEHRRRAEIPWAASSREQAELGYTQAAGFVRSSDRLSRIIRCYDGYRRVTNKRNGGRIQIFAADDAHADGILPTDAFIDELHRHKDLKLYRTWRGKLRKRGGQMATISTAGEPGSEFEETRKLIRTTVPVVEMRPGYTHCRSDQIALHEYAVPEGADVEDMQVVKLANPSPRITVETLTQDRATPTMTLSHWSRFKANVSTRGDSAAITEHEWHSAKVTDDIPYGESVWAGLDLGWKHDTTAIVPLWMRDAEYRLLGAAEIIVPPRNGNTADPDEIKAAIERVNDRNPITTVVMDMTGGAEIAAWLEHDLGCIVVDRAQSNTFKALDYSRFMEALRNGWLKHTGDAGLKQHVMNAVAKQLPGGDIVFDRPNDSRHRAASQARRVIDALVAAAMAHTAAVGELEDPGDEVSMWAWG